MHIGMIIMMIFEPALYEGTSPLLEVFTTSVPLLQRRGGAKVHFVPEFEEVAVRLVILSTQDIYTLRLRYRALNVVSNPQCS